MSESLREKLAEAVKMIGIKGKAYAEAKALSWNLQEMRKVVLSEQTRVAKGSSMAERENEARCSEAYKIHLAGTQAAIKNELIARAECEKYKAVWESVRSLISFEKTQMRIFNEGDDYENKS